MRKTNNAWGMLMADVAGDPDILEGIRSSRVQAETGVVACKIREDAGLLQEELGRKLSVSATFVDDLEVGDSLDMLRKIAAVLCVKLDAEIERIKSMRLETTAELR